MRGYEYEDTNTRKWQNKRDLQRVEYLTTRVNQGLTPADSHTRGSRLQPLLVKAASKEIVDVTRMPKEVEWVMLM